MSDMMGSFDPKKLAENTAIHAVMSLQNQSKTQKTKLTSQLDALKSLRTALTDFRTAMTDLNKLNNGVLQNKVAVSKEGFVDIKVNSSAAKGTYNIYVESLASARQVAFEGMSDSDVANATGKMSLTMGGKTIEIDMDDISTLPDLANAINGHPDNPGVTGSLVRTDGKVTLMLSSDKSGLGNEISYQVDPSLQMGTERMISKAADAVVWLGEKGQGLKQISSSNVFDNLIKGVTVELTHAQKADEEPLVVTVGSDDIASQAQTKKFIDSYNTLKNTLAQLTKSGTDNKKRGSLAGDSSITALQRQFNSMLRESFNGKTLADVGVSADKEGMLKLDSKKFDKALKEDPQSLNGLFNADTGLIKKMDTSLDNYLNSGSGLLKLRQDMLDRQETQISAREKMIETRYEHSYNRYLREFTQLQQVMTQMNNTMGMFGS